MRTQPPTAVARAASACLLVVTATSSAAVDTIPIAWEAGGLGAGTDSAGQAARLAADVDGNLAVVSGPSQARDLAVTSYTPAGTLRWRTAVSPAAGTFVGDWVAAAPNGDFVAVGRSVSASSGNPITITLIRVGSDGTLLWRRDLAGTLPGVGRLLVDSAGNSYLAFNSLGDGQDIQLHGYDPAGDLMWFQGITTGFLANNIATSLALSRDETVVALTGDTLGGAEWITALYDTATGDPLWQVSEAEGTAALDVVIDETHVYVTGQGNVGINTFLTVVARDRVTGARSWRVDSRPADGTGAAGRRIAIAADGSLVVSGQASRGFLDWYTVAFETTGDLRWEAVRDGGLNTDEIPAGVIVLADGTAVVSGSGGPNLPGGYIPGVTAGYSTDGTLLWEAFSPFATKWVTGPPNGDVCATGGYDAYLACFRPSPTRVGTVPDGARVPGPPLRIGRNPDESLSLSWGDSCVPTDSDFAVYEGALRRPFSQHVPLACSTASLSAATLTPSAGSAYYLVVARDGFFEGSYGSDSGGRPRTAGPEPCLPTAGILGCP